MLTSRAERETKEGEFGDQKRGSVGASGEEKQREREETEGREEDRELVINAVDKRDRKKADDRDEDKDVWACGRERNTEQYCIDSNTSLKAWLRETAVLPHQ